MITTVMDFEEEVRQHERWLSNNKNGHCADFSNAYMCSFDLSGRDLRWARFCQADLSRADMTGAILYEANFEGALLLRANFEGAELSGASLRGVDARKVDFCSANLHRADIRYANVSGSDFRNADLSGANCSGSNFYGTNLRHANMAWTVLMYRTDFGTTKILQFGPIGSRDDQLVVKRFADGEIEAMTGCFHGTLDELAESVMTRHHQHPQYLKEYQAAIAYCRDALGVTG